MTAEQQVRDMLERMGVEDAQFFSAGDLVELANLIAERDRLMRLRDAADADEDMADHPPPGLAGGLPIDLKTHTFKMPLFTSGGVLRGGITGLGPNEVPVVLSPGYELPPLPPIHEPDAMPTRPERWAFALDFLGDPEAAEVQAYVEALEAYALQMLERNGLRLCLAFTLDLQRQGHIGQHIAPRKKSRCLKDIPI